MKKPKVGQKIYAATELYLGHGADDFEGGIATISHVYKSMSAGKMVWFVKLKENPGTGYNWTEYLSKEQTKLKKKFGKKKAHAIPDLRREFNTGW